MERKKIHLKKRKKKISQIELEQLELSEDLPRAEDDGFPVNEIFGEEPRKRRTHKRFK